MAFPTGLIQTDGFAESGIILGLNPSSDRSFDIRLQRQDTGTTWGSIQVWQGNSYNGAFQYRDLLNNDGLRRDYRARHEKSGYTAGAWTDTVSGGPILLSEGDAPQLALSRRPISVPILLSTGASLRFGNTTGAGIYRVGNALVGQGATGNATTLSS